MFKHSITTAAIVFLLSGTAMSADAIVYNEPVPVAAADTFSWTGGYIGVNAGYAWGKAKHTPKYPSRPPFNPNFAGELASTLEADHFDNNISGFIGGIQAGYNWQRDRIVLGLETDIQASEIKGTSSSTLVSYGATESTSLRTKINWFGSTRARVGYLPSERLMVYATGGVAYGKIKADYSYDLKPHDQPAPPAFSSNSSYSKTKFGYTVGAGAEYALNNNWTVKTEYLYTNLGKIQFYAAEQYRVKSYSTKVDFHTVRVGLNYKF